MGEVPLARLWQLPDGTSCVLFKDSSAENWQLRVVRNDSTLRSEMFGSALVAMNTAKEWRATYELALDAPN